MSTESAGEPASTPALCACGCSRTPNPAKRYVLNHHGRKSLDAYIEEDRVYVTPCRIWQRHTDKNGYAVVRNGVGAVRPVLQVVWERDRGTLPGGHVLERRCGERAGVNLDRARPVTRADVMSPRMVSRTNQAHQAGVCLRGHSMTLENTYTTVRGNPCRTCMNVVSAF